jgi:hypothetical protein
MKKLGVLVMMIAIATFMAAPMASADGHGHHSWGIQGEYAMTGPGSCLYSRVPFNDKHQALDPTNSWIASKLTEGTWTFERHGKGKAQYTLYGIAAPQPAFNNIGVGDSDAVSFEFTYTVMDDGTITGELVPGTYVDTFLTGPSAGNGWWSTFDKLSFFGMVSRDHKTLTLNSANEIQTATIFFSSTSSRLLYEICNYGRTLIRVDEDE